jgi:hypothetical protein
VSQYRPPATWNALATEFVSYGTSRENYRAEQEKARAARDKLALDGLRALLPADDPIFGKPEPATIKRGDAEAFLGNLADVASGKVRVV